MPVLKLYNEISIKCSKLHMQLCGYIDVPIFRWSLQILNIKYKAVSHTVLFNDWNSCKYADELMKHTDSFCLFLLHLEHPNVRKYWTWWTNIHEFANGWPFFTNLCALCMFLCAMPFSVEHYTRKYMSSIVSWFSVFWSHSVREMFVFRPFRF